jgi:hypothetical protein
MHLRILEYTLNTKKYLKQLKTFNPLREKKETSLPALPYTLTKPMDVEI